MKKKELDELETAAFCRNMAMLLNAGISSEEALDLLRDEYGMASLEGAAAVLVGKMEDGMTFSEAVSETGVLPRYASQLIVSGEQTGRTDSILERLADYYERRHEIREHLHNVLTYPTMLLLLMGVILLTLVWKVVPMFVGVYRSLGGGLVGGAYGYITAAQIIAWVALAVTLAACVVLLGGMSLTHSEGGRSFVLGTLERLPATAHSFRQMSISRLLDEISTFSASGADSELAMHSATQTVTNEALRKELELCEREMQTGESLAQTFQKHHILEPAYSCILASGSRSGHVDETLQHLAKLAQQDAEEEVTKLVDTVEPVLTGFLTIAVGGALLAVMLPLIGILGSIG